MKARNLFLSISKLESESKKSLFLTLLLSTILFWIGLGVGDNMSDSSFWIQSTWTSIKLEWLFILLYVITLQKLPPINLLWRNYRFITIVAILWMTTVFLSYFTTSLYSWQNPLAFMRVIETVTHFLFFLAILSFFRHYKVNYHIIFSAVILSSLIVMSYFVYIYFAFPGLEADRHVFSIRSDKLILNTHIHRIGYQIEVTIALAVAFLFSKKYHFQTIIIMGVLFIFLLWLGGRASILGITVALITFFLHLNSRFTLKHLLLLLAVILPIIYLISHINLDLGYLGNALQKTFQAGSIEHLASGRIQLWSLVIDNLHGHWLLGTGPQSYFFYPHRVLEVIHAHNFVLQFLGEWGIVGTSLFFIMLYHAIHHGIVLHFRKSSVTEYYAIAAGVSLLALFITGLFSGVFFYHQTVIYLLLSLAIWVTPSK